MFIRAVFCSKLRLVFCRFIQRLPQAKIRKMKKEKLFLGIILFVIGLIGILSMLTMEIPIPEEAKQILLDKFSPQQIKLLILINPIILLIVTVLTGTVLHEKVNLKVPIIKGAIRKEKDFKISTIVKSGVIGGIIAGILLTLIGFIYYPILPQEFIELGEKLKPGLAVRFLYGGFTEELLMRFGLMTFVVWLSSKIFNTLNSKIYWSGILIAAVIFALGHFPIAFQTVESPSNILLSYILIGNSIGGIIFGWLYWKKGLESAFIAHIFAHVIMLIGEPLLNMN